MLLAPSQFVTWDFWIIQDERGMYHAFYLQAPREIDDPERRHNKASVGHSVSKDLITWWYRGVAIDRGACGSWHDLANWTGSVALTPAGDYMMLITGRSTQENGTIQRIGCFYSKDLYLWIPDPGNPLMVCDLTIYHPYHVTDGTTTWRDPWLHWDDKMGQWYAFITAQKKDETVTGCIAVSVFRDQNQSWSIQEPLDTPDYFDLMECPVIRNENGVYYLFVNVDKRWIKACAPQWVDRKTGTHLLKSPHLWGPYEYVGCLLDGGIDVGGEHKWRRYQFFPLSVQDVSNEVVGVCWEGYQEDGAFLGGLSAPMTLSLNPVKHGHVMT